MNVNLKTLHPNARIPAYATEGGACLELDVARALEMQVLILPEGPGE